MLLQCIFVRDYKFWELVTDILVSTFALPTPKKPFKLYFLSKCRFALCTQLSVIIAISLKF